MRRALSGRVARGAAADAAASTKAWSRASASAALSRCVRCASETTRSSLFFVNRAACVARSCARTAGGSFESSTLNRSSAFVDTLFTFWPPAPDARL